MSYSLWPHGLQPVRLLCPRDSLGKNTGTSFPAFLQGIFLTQRSNPCLLHLLLHWQAGVPPGKPCSHHAHCQTLCSTHPHCIYLPPPKLGSLLSVTILLNEEGNGNPLKYSCLENPRDGEARWAAVYGVTQSWTRLRWLSSSRSILLKALPYLY